MKKINVNLKYTCYLNHSNLKPIMFFFQFAAGLLIAAGMMVSDAISCQLEKELQPFDLNNKKFFCKHYAIKNTPALYLIGIIVLASNTINIVFCVCQCYYRCCYKSSDKCIRYNGFCEYTQHKWTVVLVSPFVSILQFKNRLILCFFNLKMNIMNILTDLLYISEFCNQFTLDSPCLFHWGRHQGASNCKFFSFVIKHIFTVRGLQLIFVNHYRTTWN